VVRRRGSGRDDLDVEEETLFGDAYRMGFTAQIDGRGRAGAMNAPGDRPA